MTNIYVGNLSFRATESELTDAFSHYGDVGKVSIIIDRETGRSRGFGFVEMTNSQEARAAIQGLNQSMIGDRAISCNEARERESRPSGGGYGGGYSGGRSNGNGGYGDSREHSSRGSRY
jgi:RNA recognition motif-containing protein